MACPRTCPVSVPSPESTPLVLESLTPAPCLQSILPSNNLICREGKPTPSLAQHKAGAALPAIYLGSLNGTLQKA